MEDRMRAPPCRRLPSCHSLKVEAAETQQRVVDLHRTASFMQPTALIPPHTKTTAVATVVERRKRRGHSLTAVTKLLSYYH